MVNLLTAGMPGTENLREIGPENNKILVCDNHRNLQAMFNVLHEGELVPVCGQCFFEEVSGDQFGEAELAGVSGAEDKEEEIEQEYIGE